MCCSCASHLLCGIQTACRIHHCCKRLATPGPVHFPTGSLFLRQNTGNFKHQITNKENICNKTYTFYYLSNRHTLLNHHNASLYLLLHIMETRCKSHSHLSTRWDGEKKSCLGSTHNVNLESNIDEELKTSSTLLQFQSSLQSSDKRVTEILPN